MIKNKFDEINTIFELLDVIRIRHQMFALSIEALSGILTGFSIAKNIADEEFDGFHRYLANKLNKNYNYYSWMELIESISEHKEYEIPIFYKYLDEFRKTEIEVYAEVELSHNQRQFDFDRRIAFENIDKPRLPLKAPHQMVAIKIKNARIHTFYYDKDNNKYYEQCLKNKEALFKWAKDCYDIPYKQWALKKSV